MSASGELHRGNRRGARRWLRLVLPILLLVVGGVTGLRNGVSEFRGAATGGQRFSTATEVAHGLASWLALYALLRQRVWARPAMIVWGALLTATAASATMTWGDAGADAALVAGVSVAGVCALAIWLAFPRSRPSHVGEGPQEVSREESTP
jgi:hypothetical protein